MPSVTFVVMAGGRGERLWPLVRATSPKVCLSPTSRRSLLQETIARLRPVWPEATWLIVTTQEQAAAVRADAPRSLRRAVMVEPQVKNTAACITLAAVALAIRDPHRIMVVVPADHWIEQVAVFRRAVGTAIRAAASQDTIAMIGIHPTHPHPGFGYLCAGSALSGFRAPRVFRLARFVEKPSRAQGRRLLRRPRTYWNSGIFVGSADKFLECITEWLPDHTRRIVPLAEYFRHERSGATRPRRASFTPPHGSRGAGFTRAANAAYHALQSVSFDHGVMDHVQGGLVVEGRFAWADLGSWDAWAALGRASSRTIAIDSHNVTVVSPPDHLVATIGVRDLLLVHTPSATLICRADKAQRVREVVRRVATDPRLCAYR
jgi:mannose-1-phosphate guanylyltransferase